MKIYFLEEVYFEKVDSDGERCEYRIGDGFWANKRKLNIAKNRIKKNIGEGWELCVTVFDIDITHNQKYLYVLNHEYSLSDGTCYFYQFDPQTNKKKCHLQYLELSSLEKYSVKPERVYDHKNFGWFVEKYEIVY